MESINKLKKIWDNIPKDADEHYDYNNVELLERSLDLFNIADNFYLIFNTQTATIEYVNPNIEAVLGYLPEQFNLDLLLTITHPEDIIYFFEYEKMAVEFFAKLAKDYLHKYKFSYDYRLKSKDGSYRRILQQTTPLHYFPQGGARTLVVLTDVTHLNLQEGSKLSFIGMEGAPSYYNIQNSVGFKPMLKLFTKRESEILQLLLKGMTSQQIAEKLNVSFNTVQSHRKNIRTKSGCNSVQTLLVKSIREGWV